MSVVFELVYTDLLHYLYILLTLFIKNYNLKILLREKLSNFDINKPHVFNTYCFLSLMFFEVYGQEKASDKSNHDISYFLSEAEFIIVKLWKLEGCSPNSICLFWFSQSITFGSSSSFHLPLYWGFVSKPL